MIAWFARNGVSANFLMILIVVGGLVVASQIKLELFPETDLETISIRVPYPGAAPVEVENGICIRIEERIQDLSGIRRLRSSAQEGLGVVTVEVERGFDARNLLDRIKTRVDAIDTFPLEAEPPVVEKLIIENDTISIAVFGDLPERTLREVAEQLRDELTLLPEISQVRLQGVRQPEIVIEVTDRTLDRHQLSFGELAQRLREASVDLPGGVIRSPGGEILLRSNTLAQTAEAFARLPVHTGPDGATIYLENLATIREGFEEQPLINRFNGKPAATVRVYAVGQQSPLRIAEAVYDHVETFRLTLPEGIEVEAWRDFSIYLRDRLQLLIRNGLIGLVLVFVVLTLFLRPSLAVFVSLGIPVSFFGTLLLMPTLGLSINLMTLFAFILVLGVVVDDAIVVGESVFSEFQRKGPGLDSAISGSKKVAMPVTFAVLTTVVAFTPILFLPGIYGAFFFAIPAIVIPTLLFSLVQAKLILPYHLSLCHLGQRDRSRIGRLRKLQLRLADGLEHIVQRRFRPFLEVVLRWRYLTLALATSLLFLCVGLLAGNWVRFVFFSPVPSDYIVASLRMPEGTPFEKTKETVERMERELNRVIRELEAEGLRNPVRQIGVTIGGAQFLGGGPAGTQAVRPVTERAEIAIELVDPEIRDISAPVLSDHWRRAIGDLPEARDLTFQAVAGAGTGPAIEIQLQGPSLDDLGEAATALRDQLATFPDLFDIRDNYPVGKDEVRLTVRPEAEAAGFSQRDLARQVRQAIFGEEVQRVQQGRNDVRVMLRLPDSARRSIWQLEDLRIRGADGRSAVIGETARLEMGESLSQINREDRFRTVTVQADADKEATDVQGIIRELSREFLPGLEDSHPGLRVRYEGEQRELRDLTESLIRGMIFILIAVYALMAIPFRSYTQPLIVMSVIPFGLIGAVLGHLVTFQEFSILSLLGLVALTGVIINNSLVLVDCVNQHIAEGLPRMEAVREATLIRFRPILLTSLTTFAGLIPILLETNLQARFLIPMATSLAFGVLVSGALTVVLVPSLYLILEDLRSVLPWKKVISPGHAGMMALVGTAALAMPAATAEAVMEPRLASPHPRLLEANPELAEANPTDPRWRSFLERAGRAIDHPPPIPSRGGQWIFYYANPANNATLEYRDGQHVCPLTGAVFDDERTRLAYKTIQHQRVDAHVWKMARAYHLSGEDRFAAEVARIFEHYAGLYPTWERFNRWNHRVPVIGGKRFCQGLDEAVALVQLARAYDLVHGWPGWTPDLRERIERDLFGQIVDTIYAFYALNNARNNHMTWHNAGVATIAVVMGREDWLRQATEGLKGLLFQLEHSVTAEGLWFEGALAYHYYALQAIIDHLLAERAAGRDLTQHPVTRQLFLAPLELAYPNGQLPAFNDGDRAFVRGYRHLYRQAAQWWPEDPILAAFAGEGTIPATTSALYKDAGLAYLRYGVETGAATAILDFGQHGGHHGHPDKLQLLLFAHGQEVFPDPGRLTYRVPEHQTWSRTTVAHNTMVVNQTNQLPKDGQLLLFEEASQWSAVAGEADQVYPGYRLRRLLVLWENRFLLDLFVGEAMDDAPSAIWDWVLHGKAELDATGDWTDFPEQLHDRAGYPHLKQLQRSDWGKGSQRVTWGLPKGEIVSHFHLAEPAGVWTGVGIGHTLDSEVPLILLRREELGSGIFVLHDLRQSGEDASNFSVKSSPEGMLTATWEAGEERFRIQWDGLAEGRVLRVQSSLSLEPDAW